MNFEGAYVVVSVKYLKKRLTFKKKKWIISYFNLRCPYCCNFFFNICEYEGRFRGPMFYKLLPVFYI